MKLWLVVLFASLFLVVSVSGRPSAKTRARRFRRPAPKDLYRKQLVNAANFGQQKDVDGDPVAEDMFERSGSRSEDIEEWLEMIIKECHLDMDMRKVTPADVLLIVNSAARFTNEAVKELSPHNDVITKLEEGLKDQTLEELILSHGELLQQFQSLMESAVVKGLCPFVALQILLDRITYLGADGFAGSQCNEAHNMMPSFADVVAVNDGKPVVQWLYKFGEAIRNDMRCIIQDIANLDQRVMGLKNKADQAAPSLRDIQQGLATIMASTGVVENEIDQFREAVEKVGHFLEKADLQQLQAVSTDGVNYKELIDEAKRFLAKIKI